MRIMKIVNKDASGRPIGRRKRGHDYQAPWKYHITLLKVEECIPFSQLVVTNLSKGEVDVRNSLLGQIIWRHIRLFQQKHIAVYQYKIMPDHLHLLIHVKQTLPRHLGYYLGKFKAGIVDELRKKTGNSDICVFQSNYHDRIVLPEHDLTPIYEYIRQNPYRLAVRIYRPEFFQRKRGIVVCQREFHAYGNLFHLRNPFKYPLIVHRADSDKQFADKLGEALYFAANGGVVVSAFISPREKMVRREIEAIGGRIILLQHTAYKEREKPARHDFEQCCDGNLLILTPADYQNLEILDRPSRSQCLDMNSMAEKIAISRNKK